MNKLTSLLFVALAMFTAVCIYKEYEREIHLMNSVGIPSKIFGPYVFIYDGIYDYTGNLKGGIPQWVNDNGSNIAILSFLDPVEVEASAIPPTVFLESIVAASSSPNFYLMFSIGGWDFQSRFVLTDPAKVAANLATMAVTYNVGIEIDCESDNAKAWIEAFITAYRAIIPNDGVNWYSVLTMDTGASPGAFPNVEQAALNNLDNLNWVNAMVYDPEQSPDNRQFWDYHKIPASQFTVARNLVDTCNDLASLTPTLSYQKNGEDIRGILFWAALSPETCQNTALHCGTSCADCTGGVGSVDDLTCPALTAACQTYGVC